MKIKKDRIQKITILVILLFLFILPPLVKFSPLIIAIMFLEWVLGMWIALQGSISPSSYVKKIAKDLYLEYLGFLKEAGKMFLNLLYINSLLNYIIVFFLLSFIFYKEFSIFALGLHIGAFYFFLETMAKPPEDKIGYFSTFTKSLVFLFSTLYLFSLYYNSSFLDVVRPFIEPITGEKIFAFLEGLFRDIIVEIRAQFTAVVSLVITTILELYRIKFVKKNHQKVVTK